MKKNISGISIIELIVGIFIFSLGLSAIYLVIVSSINVNLYNENQIIASNLSREGIELIKNLRDSNYENLHKWDTINPNISNNFNNSNNYLQTGAYYKVQSNNNITHPDFSVQIEKILNFKEGKDFISTDMKNYELCLDRNGVYSYNCALGDKRSGFFRYVSVKDLKYKDSSGILRSIPNAYELTSKVIWYKRGYHEIKLTTILADYKRF